MARWVLKRLQAASKTDFRGVPNPYQVLSNLRLPVPERLWYISMPGRRVDPDSKYLRPNPDHPWVRLIVDQMPSLRPTYMIRLCLLDCHTITPASEQIVGREGWDGMWQWWDVSGSRTEHERRKQEQWHNSEKGRRISERR